MQEAENLSSQDESLAGDVMESLGMPETTAEVATEPGANENEHELPEFAKKKLGKMQKRHEREMRQMREELRQLRSQGNYMDNASTEPPINYGTNSGAMSTEDERIHKAVIAALKHKDMQEQQAKNAEKVAHVHRSYQALQDHLDDAGTKYDDFDEVVRAPDAPFTQEMRDAALLIPNAADVLYKLGKNKDELSRISNLHPLEQAKEMVKLSFALMNGGNEAKAQPPKTIGQIKSNPVTSRGVNENTPVGDLRRLMKSGWKG